MILEIINAIALIVPKVVTALTVDLPQAGLAIGSDLGAAPGELSPRPSSLLRFSSLQKNLTNQKMLLQLGFAASRNASTRFVSFSGNRLIPKCRGGHQVRRAGGYDRHV